MTEGTRFVTPWRKKRKSRKQETGLREHGLRDLGTGEMPRGAQQFPQVLKGMTSGSVRDGWCKVRGERGLGATVRWVRVERSKD